MPRRMPKRGEGGKFLGHDAQRESEERRPEGDNNSQTQKIISTPSGIKQVDAQREAIKRRCEECRTELEERRVRVKGHVFYVQHCPRCCPDPLAVMQG